LRGNNTPDDVSMGDPGKVEGKADHNPGIRVRKKVIKKKKNKRRTIRELGKAKEGGGRKLLNQATGGPKKKKVEGPRTIKRSGSACGAATLIQGHIISTQESK